MTGREATREVSCARGVGGQSARRAEPEGNCFIEVACRANDESRAAIYLQFAFDLLAGFIATRNAN